MYIDRKEIERTQKYKEKHGLDMWVECFDDEVIVTNGIPPNVHVWASGNLIVEGSIGAGATVNAVGSITAGDILEYAVVSGNSIKAHNVRSNAELHSTERDIVLSGKVDPQVTIDARRDFKMVGTEKSARNVSLTYGRGNHSEISGSPKSNWEDLPLKPRIEVRRGKTTEDIRYGIYYDLTDHYYYIPPKLLTDIAHQDFILLLGEFEKANIQIKGDTEQGLRIHIDPESKTGVMVAEKLAAYRWQEPKIVRKNTSQNHNYYAYDYKSKLIKDEDIGGGIMRHDVYRDLRDAETKSIRHYSVPKEVANREDFKALKTRLIGEANVYIQRQQAVNEEGSLTSIVSIEGDGTFSSNIQMDKIMNEYAVKFRDKGI